MSAPARKSLGRAKAGVRGFSSGALPPASRQRRFYEDVCERIVQVVRRERLKPGQRLPPERTLAKELRVSRTSIREAMIALETARIIEVRLGSGCYLSVLIG